MVQKDDARLEEKLGIRPNVSPDAHFMGAIGAALLAVERAESAAVAAPDPVDLRGWEDGR